MYAAFVPFPRISAREFSLARCASSLSLSLVSTLFFARCFFLAAGEIKRASIRACTRCGVSCKVFDCSICVVVGVLFAHMYHFIGAHSSRINIRLLSYRAASIEHVRCLPNINLTTAYLRINSRFYNCRRSQILCLLFAAGNLCARRHARNRVPLNACQTSALSRIIRFTRWTRWVEIHKRDNLHPKRIELKLAPPQFCTFRYKFYVMETMKRLYTSEFHQILFATILIERNSRISLVLLLTSNTM
jgi:hypothetical protein